MITLYNGTLLFFISPRNPGGNNVAVGNIGTFYFSLERGNFSTELRRLVMAVFIWSAKGIIWRDWSTGHQAVQNNMAVLSKMFYLAAHNGMD